MIDDVELCRAEVVGEVIDQFNAYEAALVAGDAAMLNRFFWSDDAVRRFGVADRQHGYAELQQWRTTQGPLPGRMLAETEITTFGGDVAVVTTLFSYPGRAFEGRQSQTWVRRPEGWRIAAAHVSEVALDAMPSELSGRQLLVVVGAHLRGQPLNHQLADRGARFVQQTATASLYRLLALPTEPPKPALVRAAERDGHAIEVELWDMGIAEFGGFVASIPAPLGIGSVELADGRNVPGFVGQASTTNEGHDITEFGGWRAFLASHSIEG